MSQKSASRRTHGNLLLYELKHFTVTTLEIQSEALKGNPWKASLTRFNPVLVPNTLPPRQGWPVVFVLAGFTGNGPQYFAPKGFEPNLVQTLDHARGKNEAPNAVFVFVDAWTPWGGGQFINSEGHGNFADYITEELVPLVKRSFPLRKESKFWAVVGGSSGGYGALALASSRPDIWAVVGALAPDSAFELSLMPDIAATMPHLARSGGLRGLWAEMESGRLHQRKDAHAILNAVAMGLAYAPRPGGRDVDWPISARTGDLKEAKWRRWLAHDPVVFLKERRAHLRRWHRAYLDVGQFDQFHLQFGTRRIKSLLQSAQVLVSAHEFPGTHFDLGQRRPHLWRWLARVWKV